MTVQNKFRAIPVVTALAVVATLALSAPVHAGVCVTINVDRDTLSPEDQRAARITLENTLESHGIMPIGEPCDTTYVLSHTKLGEEVTIRMAVGDALRTLRARGIEDLPSAYDQMVASIKNGTPLADNIGRRNVLNKQTNRNKQELESMLYLALGGVFSELNEEAAPMLRFGYRFETDSGGFGINGHLTPFPTTGGGGTGVDFEGLYFLDGEAGSSLYLGGALGYQGYSYGDPVFDAVDSTVGENGSTWSGAGFAARPIIGWEFFRATAGRLFIQAEANLPMYQMERGGEEKWNPSLMVTIGGGFDVDPAVFVLGALLND